MRESRPSPVDRRTVEDRLARVTDPELDRSIVDLGYVDDVTVDDGDVRVDLVLPTAWCSPAFAWMMVSDARDAVEDVAGVDEVTVTLRDHMHGEEITRGVNRGHAFQAVFDDAEDGVDAVRDRLDHKARLARQHDAVEALLEAGLTPDQATRLRRRDLRVEADRVAVFLPDRGFGVVPEAEPVARYLEKARERGLVTGPEDRLLRDADGDPVDPASFEAVHRDTRLVRSNMEGQGEICGLLHEARNGVPAESD